MSAGCVPQFDFESRLSMCACVYVRACVRAYVLAQKQNFLGHKEKKNNKTIYSANCKYKVH